MPYTHPIDLILVYSAWGLVLLTMLFATIYTWLRKSTGELWAAALDEDRLRTTRDMTPQQFARWIGDENLGRSAKEIDAMADKVVAHFNEPTPSPQYINDQGELVTPTLTLHANGRIEIFSPPSPQEAPIPTPLAEAHAILDEPELPAPVLVKRSRANLKPPAKRVRKAKQKGTKNARPQNVSMKQSV